MSLLKELYAKDELPYDKFMRLGPDCLSDAELLAIMLRTGTRERTPIELGRDVLKLSLIHISEPGYRRSEGSTAAVHCRDCQAHFEYAGKTGFDL